MRKLICVAAFLMTAALAGAVPNQITYQGTLKESGVPVTGSRTMQFRLTNIDGTAVYWSGGSMNVTVNQGLFSAVLPVSGVAWRGISPYIEVSVQGQLLLPREPVASTAYAQMCGTVDDGSVLSGMIAMFATACPSGWTRFTALDGLFPMGGASYGTTGGNAAHAHSLAITQTIGGGGATVVGTSRGGNGELLQFGGPGGFTVDARSANTTSQNSLPPYLTMVYCQKQ